MICTWVKTLVVMTMVLGTAVGCSKTLTDYVSKAVPPDPPAPMRGPAADARGPMRVGAGAGVADLSAGNLRLRAVVNRNGRLVGMGSDRTARLLLNQTRAQQ